MLVSFERWSSPVLIARPLKLDSSSTLVATFEVWRPAPQRYTTCRSSARPTMTPSATAISSNVRSVTRCISPIGSIVWLIAVVKSNDGIYDRSGISVGSAIRDAGTTSILMTTEVACASSGMVTAPLTADRAELFSRRLVADIHPSDQQRWLTTIDFLLEDSGAKSSLSGGFVMPTARGAFSSPSLP